MTIGRIAPVPDRLRFGKSDAAQRLDYLRALADDLDNPPKWRELPPDYDRQCYRVAMNLRLQGASIIEAGVRCG